MEHTKAWSLPCMTPILTRDKLKDVNGNADKLKTILRRGGLGQVWPVTQTKWHLC